MRRARSSTRRRGTSSPTTAYAATSMETVARRAGVSTKTLYRLIPNKAALFEDMVRTGSTGSCADVNLQRRSTCATSRRRSMRADGLRGTRRSTRRSIAIQRMVLQEAGTVFRISRRRSTKRRCSARSRRSADWLRMQQRRGLIELDDLDEAAGMLLGMVVSAPQRAAMFGGVPLPSRRADRARGRAAARSCSCGVAGCKRPAAAEAAFGPRSHCDSKALLPMPGDAPISRPAENSGQPLASSKKEL